MGTPLVFPPDFTHPAQKAITASRVARRIANLVTARRAVVQAGGCSGLWPLALAVYFARVYTFEPEPANFACLRANVASKPAIEAFACAVGEAPAHVGMTRPKVGAGLWRVEGDGEIPMVTIDEVVGDAPVDAIVLDVEGHEVQALRGAARVVATHRPLLWFEMLRNIEGIEEFLGVSGYLPPMYGIGGDGYSVHASRVQ